MPRANRLDEEEEEAKADICVPLLTLSVRLGASYRQVGQNGKS